MSQLSDWSEDETNAEDNDNEEVDEFEEVLSESEDDEFDCDVDIEGDESDYIDKCPVNILHFDLIKKLGSGAYGHVFLVRKNCGIDIDSIYALKIIDKDEVCKNPKTITHMKAERKVLEIIQGCPYIPKLYYAFQTEDKLFHVTDYLPGGEMFTLLQKGALPEDHVRFYIAELIVALEHIHKQDIVYRDIKLENVLIDADGHIKLVDFGLCKKLGPRGRSKSFCGTVEYMAPEVIAGTGHNTAADWWALGVIAIELLTTVTPFGVNEAPDGNEIMKRITDEPPIMPQSISEDMEDFILKMLTKDATERLGGSERSAAEIKRHSLFNGIDWEQLENKQLPAPAIPTITGPYDVQNFSEEFTQQPACCELSAVPPNTFLTFKEYSYIAPELMPTQTNSHADSIDENRNSLSLDVFYNREPNSEFDQKYRFDSPQPLGNGKSSVCMKCVKLSDNTSYAVKIYRRQYHNVNEIDVLRKATAKPLPGVLHLFEVLTDSKWTYLIMELMIDGVNLLKYFSTTPLKRLTVFNAFNALWDIVKSVHSLKYAHGRICFKNLCYLKNSKDQKSSFRLIGFSNAKPIKSTQDKQIDYWSLGVCIYHVLCGHAPFDLKTGNVTAMTSQIESNDFDQDSEQWTALNKEIKCFIDQLLCSSKPKFSIADLKKINFNSIEVVTCSSELIDENENIIAIRAAKMEHQPKIETESIHVCNGKEIVTNGNGAIELHADVKIVDASVNHPEYPESQRNGHVEKTASKRPHEKTDDQQKLENKYKKRKQEPVESVPMMDIDQIKKERPQRTKRPVNYKHVVNNKLRTGKANDNIKSYPDEAVQIKDEKITPPLNTTTPKNPISKKTARTGETRGRPRKAQLDVPPPVKEKRTPKTLQKGKHSVPPKQLASQPEVQYESSNVARTGPIMVNQSVQTDRTVQCQLFFGIRLNRPATATNYCFERHDYIKEDYSRI